MLQMWVEWHDIPNLILFIKSNKKSSSAKRLQNDFISANPSIIGNSQTSTNKRTFQIFPPGFLYW
jgi:hypothetical protein